MLFDYAVAVLALGETLQPGSLAEVLDEDPNLAITVRPSLGYLLAVEWAADATRRVFWHLALRLAYAHRRPPFGRRDRGPGRGGRCHHVL